MRRIIATQTTRLGKTVLTLVISLVTQGLMFTRIRFKKLFINQILLLTILMMMMVASNLS
jgi:hypothetical protein